MFLKKDCCGANHGFLFFATKTNYIMEVMVVLTFLITWIVVTIVVIVASGIYVAGYSTKRHIPDEIEDQIRYISLERVCDLMIPYFIMYMPSNFKIILAPFIMIFYILLSPVTGIITAICNIKEIDKYCQLEKAG